MNENNITVNAQGVMQYRGRDVLRNVYFRIDIPAYVNALNCHTEDAQEKERVAVAAFDQEIVAVLQRDGWALKDGCRWGKDKTGCPEMQKGAQTLYCHPQSISGHVLSSDVERLETLFRGCTSFGYRWTDQYEFVVVTTSDEDETALYAEEYGPSVRKYIQDAFTTPRRNLYKRDFHELWRLYEKLYIRTTRVHGVLSSDNPGYRWIGKQYEDAVAAGLIVVPQDGLARWLNKTEYAAWLKKQPVAA